MALTDPTADPTLLTPHFPQFDQFEFMKKGGYKYVFKVRQKGDGYEVLKIINLPDVATGLSKEQQDEAKAIREQELGRARREVNILAECKSPFVVKLGSLGPNVSDVCGGECLSYSEELLPGENLIDAIKSGVKPTEAEVRSLMRCLLLAINSLWTERRVVHRDIKPGNVMKTGLKDRPYVLLGL